MAVNSGTNTVHDAKLINMLYSEVSQPCKTNSFELSCMSLLQIRMPIEKILGIHGVLRPFQKCQPYKWQKLKMKYLHRSVPICYVFIIFDYVYIYIYIHIYKHICAQCCCFLLIFWQTWQNKWKAVRPQTCMRIELCSSFLVCSTCTSHDILIYNHIWSVVGNFEQWESSLSRRSAILRLATAIPSWQDSLFLADTGLPGPTHNQPGRQHVWCVEAKLLWLVELPHKASAFWQTCQAWPRPQWQQCWIYHTSIWQTSPASPLSPSPTCRHCDVTHLSLTTGVVALHIPSWRVGVRQEHCKARKAVWPVNAGRVICRYQNNLCGIINHHKHIRECFCDV